MTSDRTETATVRCERTLTASPHEIYRAWLDPTVLRRWLAPGTAEVARVEVDERVGGRFRIWQTQDGDAVGGFDAQLLELVPDERIVLRWGFVGPARDAGPTFDSLLTVTLRGTSGGGTDLVLVHERLDDLAAAMPEVADQVGAGWDAVLDRLATVTVPA